MAGDSFEAAIRPPLDETLAQREARKICEAEAKRVSDSIDEKIKKDRQALQKQKDLIKILLLGQSESGKSTTLKNFRLEYARNEWEAEKAGWRAVIQLNLIRSIISILDALQAEINGEPLRTSVELDEPETPTESKPLAIEQQQTYLSPQDQLSAHELEHLQTLRLKLSPLRHVEADLKSKLGAATEEVTGMEEIDDSRSESDSTYLKSLARSRTNRRRIQGNEMVVRGLRWREMLSYGRRNVSAGTRDKLVMDDGGVGEILERCKEDMKTLWTSKIVSRVLIKRNITMENNAGFFLNDIDRIASSSYLPSDDDIVRSRLRTLGVQEYRINVDSHNIAGSQREWVIYDVGGSRTMRRAWLPYFEDVNVIIFLAPLSCFDENLLEDPTVNRLVDSIGLWKTIISSKLLQKTTMVCFLNKCDLLQRKLKSGVQFGKVVRDYGDQPNEVSSVVKFIKERFKNVALRHSVAQQRQIYLYSTSVTDTKATASTIRSVRDSIFKENLTAAKFV